MTTFTHNNNYAIYIYFGIENHNTCVYIVTHRESPVELHHGDSGSAITFNNNNSYTDILILTVHYGELKIVKISLRLDLPLKNLLTQHN